jgi:hypothetical protein
MRELQSLCGSGTGIESPRRCKHAEKQIVAKMTLDQARELIIEAMNYAAYRETDSSLYDSDKNRLFGSEHYRSGRMVVRPSPWAEGDFERKMISLLRWADILT